jgi:DNA modification methylase
MATQKKKTVYKKIRKTKKRPASKPALQQKPKETTVELSKAKGRPMLVWVGKKPLERLTAFPAQKVEEFAPSLPSSVRGCLAEVDWNEWPSNYPKNGLLFHGDNKEVLAHLLANGFRGKIKLIYIDPPFDSGADYVRKVNLRGNNNTTKIEGQDYALGEQLQYTDIWANDNYLQFMYERLILLKELLSEDGTIWLHCDDSKNHFLRCLLDEVFGTNNFLNEMIHCYGEREKIQRSFNRKHQTIYWYAKDKSSGYTYNAEVVREEFSETTVEKYKYADETGRKYRIRGVNREEAGSLRAKTDLRPQDEGEFTYRDYFDERSGPAPRDWFIKPFLNQAAGEREAYPTQKNSAVLERLVLAASTPNDIVLDCFIGSGTTAAVAQKLGRRWIGCDINKGAIQTTSKRLQTIITEQIEEQEKRTKQGKLDLGEAVNEQRIVPAQYSFSVYRVNDYDLQIQHNEAVNLACEHIGITRSKTDSFFDGTLGKKLVKIVPFNHPVTQLDLEQIKNELQARPSETRDIVVVAFGKELATEAWLANWNKLRKTKDFPNKIELIELRTDKKYGKFIEHKPASARLSIKREKEKVKILVENFISPTIIERLSQQEGPIRPQITDWRSMVDCIMIDPNYDGKVFTIALSDVPEKKNDFVAGEYEVPISKEKTTVAVKIVDMLGEEVLITREV